MYAGKNNFIGSSPNKLSEYYSEKPQRLLVEGYALGVSNFSHIEGKILTWTWFFIAW